MTNSVEFRQYADEAREWAAKAKNQDEKQLLTTLAATWTLAAATWDQKVLKSA
jgi:hypothetical protein